MRFSIWPRPTSTYEDTIAVARYADQAGWYGLWFADHYMGDTPDGSPSDGAVLEAWSVLAALAGSTSNLRLGSLVSPTTFHHPSLLANRAATIDRISNGRFVLGLGAGWQVNEHKAYGVELLAPRERVDRIAEAIEIVHSLLRNQRTTFDGTLFQFTDAPCEPKPVQEPLPLLVGTGGPRMLRLTARFAQEWNTWGSPATVADRSAALNRACEQEGRDPKTVWRTAQALLFLVDDEAKRDKLRASIEPARALAGNAAYLIDQLGAYAEAGLDELIINDFTFGATAEARIEAFERMRTEVIEPYQS